MPFLSVIIPAFNEGRRLPETLTLVKDFFEQQDYDFEVIVVDDGSADDTVKKVKKIQKRFSQLILIENSENKGKGGVVKQGMLLAKGEYRLFIDADYSTPITELPKLLAYCHEYEVVIGSRYLEANSIKIRQPLRRRILSRSANLAIRNLLSLDISDTQCGFKLFQASAAERIFSKITMTGWSFDFELLAIAQHLEYSIKEVAVEWYDSKQSTLRSGRAAIQSLKDLLIIRRELKKV